MQQTLFNKYDIEESHTMHVTKSVDEVSSNEFIKTLRSLPLLDDISYKHNAVSLFCGGGGLDLGLAFSGFKTVFASDIEFAHCNTIRYNFSETVVECTDVSSLTGTTIRNLAQTNNVDLLVGGPPCQAFSILGKRDSFDDPRGRLVFEYARLITELQPRAFLFENVTGLLTLNKGKDWKQLINFLQEKTQYKLYYSILNAADYGIPQIRKRVFIVGFRNPSAKFEFPCSTHSNPDQSRQYFNPDSRPWIPAKFALVNVDNLPNHRIRPHGERVKNRYLMVPQGERDSIDRTDRIHPERPSGTVLVGSRSGGGRPFIHPYEPRHLTVREAARLQSFPDWYIFQETDTWQYRAVGNAVPPLLAKYIADEVVCTLEHFD